MKPTPQLTTKLTTVQTEELLAAALVGFEVHRDMIDARIADIQQQLGREPAPRRGRPPLRETATAEPRKRRHLSAAARRNIATAQKKRWAKFHKAQAA